MTDKAKPSLADRIRAALDITLAAKATIAVGTIMWIIAGLVWVAYALDPTRVAWGDYMTWSRATWLLLLWVASCIATYATVRLWMREVPIRNPQMKAGWDAGIQLLADHGKRMGDLPCFVVLGCPTRHQQDKWLRSGGVGAGAVNRDETPAIDWHLRDDCLLVFLRETGVYARMILNGDADAAEKPDEHAPNIAVAASNEEAIGDSMPPKAPDGAPGDPRPPEELEAQSPSDDDQDDLIASTAEHSASVRQTATLSAATKPSTTSQAALQSLKTLDEASLLIKDAQSLMIAGQPPPIQEPLTSIETTDGQESLTEFCSRLRAARYPHSAINGVLVVVNSRSLGGGEASAQRIGQSVCSDLGVLTDELGVETSVTIAVAEHGHRHDYEELSQRLAANSDVLPLLGRTASPQEHLSSEAIGSLADGMVENIEIQLSELLQASHSTSAPRNHRLLRILIRCRRWRHTFRAALVECVSVPRGEMNDRRETTAGGSRMLAGVYLASPDGGTERGTLFDTIVERMVAQQNHLAWTPTSRVAFQRQKAGVHAITLFCVIQFVVLAIQVYFALTADA